MAQDEDGLEGELLLLNITSRLRDLILWISSQRCIGPWFLPAKRVFATIA